MRAFLFTMSLVLLASVSLAERYVLLTGVDNGLYPSGGRIIPISPGPGFPGEFFDGDRLAGTSDVGPSVVYQGVQPGPLFDPNEFGSFSMLFRRGSVPLGPAGQLPFMGIEFLGGPLLDLDGDLTNGVRSLIPVTGQTAVAIPDSSSGIELDIDISAGQIRLLGFDATGTNEGAPGTSAAVATVVITLAGTQPNGSPGVGPNPSVDTRAGTLTPFSGPAGAVVGVYRVQSLGYELWEDTLLNSASTGPVLGTLQYLGAFDGWVIQRDSAGGWPTLTGMGLGTTPWPALATSAIGTVLNTANGVAGGTATIASALGGDQFTTPVNGGLPLLDSGGDLGAYLDGVVLPAAPAEATQVVFLVSVGYGANNSFDPVFGDTIGYDAVIVAAGGADPCQGFITCDTNCDGSVSVGDIGPFVLALSQGQAAYEAAFPTCSFDCACDVNGDGFVSVSDIGPFVLCISGG